MTYTLKDIKHLEVMADLLNATPAEPEKIDISALIASDVEHEETVDEKILSLCGKLRADGFDKHADSLESKFMAYKSASVHMYRVHDEDGEDVINFAHPDGDAKIEEASDNLGDVETIVSRHKKMVDVVNKAPTGKLALNRYLDDVKVALGFLVNPLWIVLWSKTNRMNQGIQKNTEILLSEIESIETSDEIKRSTQARANIKLIKDHLNQLLKFTTKYQTIATSPKEEDLPFINAYGSFIVDIVQPELKQLDGMMRRIRTESESTFLPNVYHTFIASQFEDVQKAIRGLWSALLEMTKGIVEAKQEYQAAKERNKAPETNPLLDSYNPNEAGAGADEQPSAGGRSPSFERDNQSPYDKGISQLNGWISMVNDKKINDAKKKQALDWIKLQIVEFQANKDNTQKLMELLGENQEFKQDWIDNG